MVINEVVIAYFAMESKEKEMSVNTKNITMKTLRKFLSNACKSTRKKIDLTVLADNHAVVHRKGRKN